MYVGKAGVGKAFLFRVFEQSLHDFRPARQSQSETDRRQEVKRKGNVQAMAEHEEAVPAMNHEAFLGCRVTLRARSLIIVCLALAGR